MGATAYKEEYSTAGMPTGATLAAVFLDVWTTSDSTARTYTVHAHVGMGIYRNSGDAYTGNAGPGNGTASLSIGGVQKGTFNTQYAHNTTYPAWSYTWTQECGAWSATYGYDDNGHGSAVTVSLDMPEKVIVDQYGNMAYLGLADISLSVTPDNISPLASPPVISRLVRASNPTTQMTIQTQLSSWGSPAEADGRYVGAFCSTSQSYESEGRKEASVVVPVRQGVPILSGQVTLTGLKYNTRYYYGGLANNTVVSVRTPDNELETVVTCPNHPAATNFTVIDPRSASFVVSDTSNGNEYPVLIQYRYFAEDDRDIPGWSTGVSSGSTVVLDDLSSDTNYIVELRAITDSQTPIFSSVATYDDAFRTTKVTASLSQPEYEPDGSNVRTTIPYTLSAVSGHGSSFDLVFQYKKASSSSWLQSKVTLENITGSMSYSLEPNTVYDFRMKAKFTDETVEGDWTTTQFTTPLYEAGTPLVAYAFANNNRQLIVTATAVGLCDALSCSLAADSVNVYQNIVRMESGSKTWTINLEKNGEAITPATAQFLTLLVDQEYSTTIKTITHQIATQYRHFGQVVMQDGTRANIVGIRVKHKNGTLSTLNATNPFVIK